MRIEIWRQSSLPEYKVSSDGRIMRIPFLGLMPHGGMRQYGGIPNKGQWDKKGKRYIFVFRGKSYKVHQLVCEAFNGHAEAHNEFARVQSVPQEEWTRRHEAKVKLQIANLSV